MFGSSIYNGVLQNSCSLMESLWSRFKLNQLGTIVFCIMTCSQLHDIYLIHGLNIMEFGAYSTLVLSWDII